MKDSNPPLSDVHADLDPGGITLSLAGSTGALGTKTPTAGSVGGGPSHSQSDHDIIRSFLSSVPAGFPLSPGAALAELTGFPPLSPGLSTLALPSGSGLHGLSPSRGPGGFDPGSPGRYLSHSDQVNRYSRGLGSPLRIHTPPPHSLGIRTSSLLDSPGGKVSLSSLLPGTQTSIGSSPHPTSSNRTQTSTISSEPGSLLRRYDHVGGSSPAGSSLLHPASSSSPPPPHPLSLFSSSHVAFSPLHYPPTAAPILSSTSATTGATLGVAAASSPTPSFSQQQRYCFSFHPLHSNASAPSSPRSPFLSVALSEGGRNHHVYAPIMPSRAYDHTPVPSPPPPPAHPPPSIIEEPAVALPDEKEADKSRPSSAVDQLPPKSPMKASSMTKLKAPDDLCLDGLDYRVDLLATGHAKEEVDDAESEERWSVAASPGNDVQMTTAAMVRGGPQEEDQEEESTRQSSQTVNDCFSPNSVVNGRWEHGDLHGGPAANELQMIHRNEDRRSRKRHGRPFKPGFRARKRVKKPRSTSSTGGRSKVAASAPQPPPTSEVPEPIFKSKEDKGQPMNSIGSVISRLRQSCECGHHCLSGLEPERVLKHRVNISKLKKEEHDMYLMGVMSACLADTQLTSKHHQRQRNRNKYVYQGREVCQEAFLYLENVKIHHIKTIRKHVTQEGIVPIRHGNTSRQPHNATSDEHQQHAHDYIQDVMDNQLNKEKGICNVSLKSLHGKYRDHFVAPDEVNKGSSPTPVMAYSTFTAFVRKKFPNVRFVGEPKATLGAKLVQLQPA